MVDPRVLLFLGIWESTLLALFSPRLVGINLTMNAGFMVGIPHGVAVYLTRSIYQIYDFPLGTHTLICVVFLIVLLRFRAGVKWSASIAGSLIGFQFLLLGEAAILAPVGVLLDVTGETLRMNPWLHVGLGWLADTPLLVGFLLFWRFRLRLLDLSGRRGGVTENIEEAGKEVHSPR